MRYHRMAGGSHLKCSLGDYRDKATCQWKAWEPAEQAEYFAGIGAAKVAPARQAAPRSTASASATPALPVEAPAEATTPAPNDPVRQANAVIEVVRGMDKDIRDDILGEFGYKPGGSYVIFLNGLDSETLPQVSAAVQAAQMAPSA